VIDTGSMLASRLYMERYVPFAPKEIQHFSRRYQLVLSVQEGMHTYDYVLCYSKKGRDFNLALTDLA
jgi:hypothetical protein